MTVAVLVFGDDRPRRQRSPLSGLPTRCADAPAEIDAAIDTYGRLVVVGTDAGLATVLSRLLRANRLNVEVAYVPRRRTAATRVYRLPAGRRAARRARRGTAGRVTLIRDETGSVIVGRADWLAPDDRQLVHGREGGAGGSPAGPSSWVAPVSAWCVTVCRRRAPPADRRSTATSKVGCWSG